MAGTTATASTYSFPTACPSRYPYIGLPNRLHRAVLPYRARVRVEARGTDLGRLAAGTGTCRAAGFEELSCAPHAGEVASWSGRQNTREIDLGILPAGAPVYAALEAAPQEYRLSMDVARLPDLGEACEPGDPGTPCPEGSACVADLSGAHVCTEGGDAGCGMGVSVIELEPWRTGGVVHVEADPALATEPSASTECVGLSSARAPRDLLFHLRMPYTGRVRIAEREDTSFTVTTGTCDLGARCEPDLGVIDAGTDLFVRANAREPFVLELRLDREVGDGEPCDPSRFTDRCAIGSVCAGSTPVCTPGGDAGCGAGTRIEPVETLADGSGYYEGSTSTAIGHREMQICDERLGATLEVVHRWVAPHDGDAVIRTTLDGVIVSVREAACDLSTTLLCAHGSELRVEGVSAGEVLYVVLDDVPDGVLYTLRASIERAGECGAEECASDEVCERSTADAPRCVAPTICGDGVLGWREPCDDGDDDPADGCDACAIVDYVCGA